MTARVGIYVGADRMAAVMVARHAIVWHASVERVEDASLEAQLEALLVSAPTNRHIRSSAFIALGPTLAQAKLLKGLPPIAIPRVVRQLVQATPSRFFLETDRSLVVAEPRACTDGWWVAVAAAGTLATIEKSCERRNLRLRGMRPVGTLLCHALANPTAGTTVTWIDAHVSLSIICGDHYIASIQRCATDVDRPISLPRDLHGPLANLDDDAWNYAGAYAAARVGTAAPLLLPRSGDAHRTQHRVARRIAALVTLMVCAIVMFAAPGIVAARTRERNERALQSLRAAASAAAKERIALEQQQSALRQLRTFASTRRLMTPFLSTLSVQLPESTAIVALRIDTLGGSFVALSPIGSELVSAVSTTPELDALQLSAPITREVVGPTELQRTAMRFRFKRRAPAARAARR